MDLQKIFSDAELGRIVDEATLYMCACPGQVAAEIRRLRELIRYQDACEIDGNSPPTVHRTIAEAGRQAHVVMEECLIRVLEIEGWDRQTLKMPDGLRRMRDELLTRDL